MTKGIICDIRDVLVFPEEEYRVNEKLVNFLVSNKEKYGFLIFFSNSKESSIEKYTNIMPELFEIVDGEYYPYNSGYVKPDVRGFEKILEDFNLQPEEVIFIDDGRHHVDAAEELGLKTVWYKDKNDFITLKNLLSL